MTRGAQGSLGARMLGLSSSLLLGACMTPAAPPNTPPAAPVQQPATVEIPIEIGNKGFAPDDSIAITKVLGDRAVFETGGTYHVEGTYRLGSQPAALLAVYATNGGVMGSNHLDVARGQGTFSFDFKLVREGYPHVSLYPKPRGQSFGGIYFGVGATVYRGSYVPGP